MTGAFTQITPLLEGKGWRAAGVHAAWFIAGCALVISRRPDAIFHAQFFAEDGHVWFADAYNIGWFSALFRSQNGYYEMLPRLAAALTLLVPMTAAPLVMNVVALIVQVLPSNLLLSRRLSGWGSTGFRAVLAFLYLALPNSREVSLTVTNSQWPLALMACLLVLGSVPDRTAWRAFDVVIYLLSGLTGPFCFLLLPIAIWRAVGRRWRWIPAGVFAATGLIQASALLVTDAASRAHNAPLGATWQMLVRILAGHVYLGTLFGSNILALAASLAFLFPVAVGGTAVFAYAWYLSKTEFRLFLLFTAATFAGSLHSPMTNDPNAYSRWRLMAGALGIRYWFLPTLAFAWSIVWCVAESPRRHLSWIVSWGLLLLLCCFGVPYDWSHPAYDDMRFAEYADNFERSSPGTRVVIPVNPSGWTVTLVKH